VITGIKRRENVLCHAWKDGHVKNFSLLSITTRFAEAYPHMTQINRLIHFTEKYKVLHVIFWIWLFFQTGHQFQEFHGGSFAKWISNTVINLITSMVCVYTILYYFIPKYLDKNKYYRFLFVALGFILLCAFFFTMVHKVFLLIAAGKAIVYSNILIYTFTLFVDNVTISGLFVAVSFISSRYKLDQRARRLEKERLETELSFLKAQMNPHFLFNALNSIYILIDLDKKEARETLLKFSGLLRYQLYECADKVYISRELQFLEDYIGIEKVRSKNLEVVYKIPPQVPNFEIAPFLVIPLVENAFKHVSRFTDRTNYINLEVRTSELRLDVIIANSIDSATKEKEHVGGIGLQNVSRRLQLLYPDRHALDINKTGEDFTIKLSIYADENDLHHS
jgi:two-component system, LytTR family, sensor kinase